MSFLVELLVNTLALGLLLANSEHYWMPNDACIRHNKPLCRITKVNLICTAIVACNNLLFVMIIAFNAITSNIGVTLSNVIVSIAGAILIVTLALRIYQIVRATVRHVRRLHASAL